MSLSQSQKDKLLGETRIHKDQIIKKLSLASKSEIESGKRFESYRASSASAGDNAMMESLANLMVQFAKENIENYKLLQKDPYFSRCDFLFTETGEIKSLYFAKFSFLQEGIYSWVAPLSKLRFEEIGEVVIEIQAHNFLRGKLLRKDQYMFVDGEVIFMSSESSDYERTLIYQEYLSQNSPNNFEMKDIVALMEKAQDKVIRADVNKSFLIAGPAGSGKTTLALHRVAYLAQSPDTSNQFKGENILVLVQDAGSKEYFGALLPKLGIENVSIMTFGQWALERLDMDGAICIDRSFVDSDRQYELEYLKIQAVKGIESEGVKFNSNYKSILKKLYEKYLSKDLFKQTLSNIAENKFDIFDLIILLKSYMNRFNEFHEFYNDYIAVEGNKKKFNLVRKKLKKEYSLIIIDEVQNYLSDQINLIKSAVDKRKNLLYVGDLNQQTRLGTLRNWEEIDESFDDESKVVLEKVYRNTKQIMNYVKSLGYEVDYADKLRDGEEVVTKRIEKNNLEEEILNVLSSHNLGTVGILSDNLEVIESLKQSNIAELSANNRVRFMTITEAQGLEFETVIFLEVVEAIRLNGGSPQVAPSLNLDLTSQIQRIRKDLKYVALTRAIERLIVLEIMSPSVND